MQRRRSLPSRTQYIFRAVAIAVIVSSVANAADHSDDPIVGRLEGSQLLAATHADFDEASLITGPISVIDAASRIGAGFQRFEGRSSLYYYALPRESSTLGAVRSFEAELEAKECAVAFKCSANDGSCFAGGATDAPFYIGQSVGDPLALPKFDGDYVQNRFGKGARYLLMRCPGPDGSIYPAFYFGENDSGSVLVLRVVEEKEMTPARFANATSQSLSDALRSNGRADVYGVYFDFNKDELRTDAKPALDEIAGTLAADPSLSLKIVGHTDNVGDDGFNLDLSQRRAAQVVRVLIDDYGVAPDRLAADGAGETQPVASNDTAEGRAQNRRVELARREKE